MTHRAPKNSRPCENGKEYKMTYEAHAHDPNSTSPDHAHEQYPLDFQMTFTMRPRKKKQSPPPNKDSQPSDNPYFDNVIAQQFMSSLIAIINASRKAAAAWQSQNEIELLDELCQRLDLDKKSTAKDLLHGILTPFAYLRYFTYHATSASFFDTFIEKELQNAPEAINLYNQISKRGFDVWELNPSPNAPLVAKPVVTTETHPQPHKLDGFFCFSQETESHNYFATPVRWQNYDFLLSIGSFNIRVIHIPKTATDDDNPAHTNELRFIKYLADPQPNTPA